MKRKEKNVTIDVPEGFNQEYDLQYDTAINKKIFEYEVCKRLNGNKDFSCFYNARTGKLVIENKKLNMKVSDNFYKLITGDRFDVSYEKNANYKLKENKFDGILYDVLKMNDIFTFKFYDALNAYSGFDNRIKVDFASLFDGNLFIERDLKSIDNLNKDAEKAFEEHKKRRIELREKFKNQVRTNENDLKKYVIPDNDRAVMNYNFRNIYKYYMKCEPNPSKNPFDSLDFLSKYSHCALSIYYPENVAYDLKKTPILILENKKTNEKIYEGSSLTKLSYKAIQEFIKSLKEVPSAKRSFVRSTSLADTFQKLQTCEYIDSQLEKLTNYLGMRINDDNEVYLLGEMKKEITEARSIMRQAYDKIYSNKFASSHQEIINDMIDRLYNLEEENGYYDTTTINQVMDEFKQVTDATIIPRAKYNVKPKASKNDNVPENQMTIDDFLK